MHDRICWSCQHQVVALIDDQIRRLREVLGASNDSDLAVKLGITRFSVSKWKVRGVIPPEYRFLLERSADEYIDYTVQFIAQNHVYKHADHHYWLRAAFYFLPIDYAMFLPALDRAKVLDFVITGLMSAAVDATVRVMRKPRCEGEADFSALIKILEDGTDPETGSAFADRIKRVLAEGRPAASPQ